MKHWFLLLGQNLMALPDLKTNNYLLYFHKLVNKQVKTGSQLLLMKKRIFIIDDEIDFCIIMKGYFEKKGYEVHAAYTLQKGLFLINEIRPDILFLDNNLPDGQGWQYVDQIVEKNPQLEVYLISAHQSKSSFSSPNKNIVVWEKPISLQLLNSVFQ